MLTCSKQHTLKINYSYFFKILKKTTERFYYFLTAGIKYVYYKKTFSLLSTHQQ